MSSRPLPEQIAAMLPKPGHIFEGKYRVEEEIGAGGFARVFKARFEDVDRNVALKILVPQSTNLDAMYRDELVARFHREARAVSDLKSPHTITLHDFGRTRGGLLYMIFEFVDGTPLDVLIKEGGPMRPARVVHVVRQVLMSLREAHKVGMLHRDIKPANVMVFDYLDQRDNVKLLDFGIAKHWTHTVEGEPLYDDLTEDGTVMGTPRYMSPEQIVGQSLTPATDVYSLGLVAYEMLVGSPAAPQTVKSEVVRRHLSPEPFEIPPDVPIPGGLRAVVSHMLAKRREERYTGADDALRALENWEQGPSRQPGQPSAQKAASHQPAQQQPVPQNSVPGSSQGAVPPGGTPRYGENSPGLGNPRAAGATGLGGGAQQVAAAGGGSVPDFGNRAAGQTGLPQAPVQDGLSQGAPPRPERTFIQVKAEPDTIDIDVPVKPTQRGFLVLAFGAVAFILAFTVKLVLAFFTLPLMLWGVWLVFRSQRLVINAETGYELTTTVVVYDTAQRGPMSSVVRFQATGTDEEENTVLKLVTHEGEFVVANGYSEAENAWVANAGNQWLQQLRARLPNPLG